MQIAFVLEQVMSRNAKILVMMSAVVCVLGVVVIPNFIRVRTTPARNACVNNLRQIYGAKEQWALENKKTTNDTPNWNDMFPYLGQGTRNEPPR